MLAAWSVAKYFLSMTFFNMLLWSLTHHCQTIRYDQITFHIFACGMNASCLSVWLSLLSVDSFRRREVQSSQSLSFSVIYLLAARVNHQGLLLALRYTFESAWKTHAHTQTHTHRHIYAGTSTAYSTAVDLRYSITKRRGYYCVWVY